MNEQLLPTTSTSASGRFYLCVIGLATVLAVLLHASLFEGRGLVPANGIFNFAPWLGTNQPSNSLLSDQYLVFVPQHEFTHRELIRGHFPLWNPNLECGIPNLASIQGALLYPINVLLLPLSAFYAGGIAAFLKLFLAGFFTMLYMRLLGASNSGAFLSGIVFSLSGFMICWLGHPHVNSAICLPALLFLIEKSFQFSRNDGDALISKPSLRIWACLGIAFGWFFLGGHPPTIIQVALFAGIYFLFRLAAHWKNKPLTRIALALAAVAVGVLLAAPALLPFLEYYRHSSMDASSLAMNRSANRFPLNTLILYLFPRLSGSPVDGFDDTMLWLGIGNRLPNFMERTGYIGVLPWMLALCAIVFNRNRWTIFYTAVVVVSLAAVYGMPPFPALFDSLPIIKDISQTRLILLAGFGVAVLAGFGWDGFYQLENRRKGRWSVVAFWVVVGLVILGYWFKVEPRWKLLDAHHRAYLDSQFQMMAGNVLVSAVLLLPLISRQFGLRSLIGLGWIALDLLSFGMGLNPAVRRESYYSSAPSIEWLQRDNTDFRVIGLGMVLVPNAPELYDIKDARGCDFATVRRYEELINGNAGSFFFYRTASALPNALPLLAVKYVLNFNSPPPGPPHFDLVYSNQITIYRNRQFQGRALTVFNYDIATPAAILERVRSSSFNPEQTLLLEQQPQIPVPNLPASATSTAVTNSSAQIASESPDILTVDALMAQPGFLLLLDTYFPGWTATVNGEKTPILRADYNFRAVQLPAGKSVVRFVYQPASFRWGIGLFLAGLAILAAMFFGKLSTVGKAAS
ncbi:MAG TPA: YfhO family protein [Candidatus Acidoferrales bacterium]|nr:YfhO family protein [Candidatus Acidoferrales bacterium]